MARYRGNEACNSEVHQQSRVDVSYSQIATCIVGLTTVELERSM